MEPHIIFYQPEIEAIEAVDQAHGWYPRDLDYDTKEFPEGEVVEAMKTLFEKMMEPLELQNLLVFNYQADESQVAVAISGTGDTSCPVVGLDLDRIRMHCDDGQYLKQVELSLLHEMGHHFIYSKIGDDHREDEVQMAAEEAAVEMFARTYDDFGQIDISDLTDYLDAYARPWILKARSDIQGLANLKPGWDGYKAPPISPEVIDYALRIIDGSEYLDLPNASIVPSGIGGIQIEWHIAEINFEIHISSAEEMTFSYDDGLETVEDDDSRERLYDRMCLMAEDLDEYGLVGAPPVPG